MKFIITQFVNRIKNLNLFSNILASKKAVPNVIVVKHHLEKKETLINPLLIRRTIAINQSQFNQGQRRNFSSQKAYHKPNRPGVIPIGVGLALLGGGVFWAWYQNKKRKAISKQNNSEIIETNDFDVIVSFLRNSDKDTLVIFDVDDTILISQDQILHANNSKILREHFKQFESEFPKEHCLKLWTTISSQRKPKLVDDNIPMIINELKLKGIKTIALTRCITGSFGLIGNVESWRFNELISLGVDFRYSFPDHPELIILKEIQPGDVNYPLYKCGIIFTAEHNKAQALGEFLKKTRHQPKKIIFIDDSLEYLELIKTFCAANNIEFQGFHYTKVRSENTSNLNDERVTLQLQVLKDELTWLSDKEADDRLNNRKDVIRP